MKTTIISHNYYPEDSGIGLYSTKMAEYLAINNEVEVITGFPYYPQWKIHQKYTNKNSYFTENINNVTVKRFKQYTPKNPSFFKRVLQMLHFFIGSVIYILKSKKTDIIIVVVPFTLSIVLGYLLKAKTGAKLIIHIQDFEFDAALDSGISENKSGLTQLLFKIEKFLFNRADMISTISYGMLDRLLKKTKKPTLYFPNWINPEAINPLKHHRHPYFKDNTFNVLYSGNIGAKQDWDFFVKIVQTFKEHTDIHFILIGDGAKKEEVVAKINNLKNISYYPPVTYDDLNDVLCSADVHVLFQKTEVVDTVMPSKILGMMASKVPSIITGNPNSEVKTQIEQSKSGFYFSDNIIDGVEAKIKDLHMMKKEDRKTIGKNARKYVIEKFSSDKVLSKFEENLRLL